MTMIQLVKALSPRESEAMKNKRDEGDVDEEKQKVSWTEFKWADKYVKTPDNRWMTYWNILAIAVNTVSIFTVYYDASFHLHGYTDYSMLSYVFEVILLLEICIFFFKAYPMKNNSHRGFMFTILGWCGLCKKKEEFQDDMDEESAIYQMSFKLIGIHYISGVFIIDVLSVLPFFLIKLIHTGIEY